MGRCQYVVATTLTYSPLVVCLAVLLPSKGKEERTTSPQHMMQMMSPVLAQYPACNLMFAQNQPLTAARVTL